MALAPSQTKPGTREGCRWRETARQSVIGFLNHFEIIANIKHLCAKHELSPLRVLSFQQPPFTDEETETRQQVLTDPLLH